jgi:cellulose synthase/poly-beta-1,6-N-acetylglucosamine synthase-like glycosyltransferase
MTVLSVVLVLVALVLFAVASTTLWWQMHAWLSPLSYEAVGFPKLAKARSSFSLIVPCREETEEVMTSTVERLLAQDHPDFEVIFSVGHDDAKPMSNGLNTVQIAEKLARRWPTRVKVSINYDAVKNKPRQLNSTLQDCSKDVVGIIDAESLTQPGLLMHVDATFRETDADVVQGAVHLMNYRDSWFSLRNCMEYRIWFRSRLHGHALSGFIPLGGNTVFIKRALIEQVGGWDGDCLAEDCEIGVRLSCLGKKIVVGYDAALTTQEETPERIPQLIKQRTRWALGFMQVLAKGEWKKLPTRSQRLHAWWTLVQQHAVAFSGVVLPLAILTGLVASVPPVVVLITFLPLVPTVAMLGFEMLILREWSQEMDLRVRLRDYVRLILSLPFYQLLLAVAVLRAIGKYVTGDFAWEKTAHAGSHIPAQLTLVSDDGKAA